MSSFGSIRDTVTLRGGVEMPRLGLGTYKTPEGAVVRDAVLSALECGYRHVDTASLYGNEAGIGEAVAESGLPREELFIATKVWNDEQGFDNTLAALASSLDRLRMDYIDLYLVHWPIPELMAETWRAMEEALDTGRVGPSVSATIWRTTSPHSSTSPTPRLRSIRSSSTSACSSRSCCRSATLETSSSRRGRP